MASSSSSSAAKFVAPSSPFKPNTFTSRVALITGGGSGIGLAITREFGVHGAKVVIMGRREDALIKAVAQLKAEGVDAHYVSGDVRSPPSCAAAVAATVAKYGRLDILVNSAAGNFLSTVEDLPPNGWKTVMDIDANGTFNMCHASFPELKKSGDACIISISAYAGYGAAWYQSHAFAAKAAVDSLTRSLALEWAEFGIRAVAISPGAISDTPGFTKLGGGIADEATVEAAISATIPAGRTGSKTEIGHTALFLASPSARYITGVILTVDGGAWLWRAPPLPRDAVKQFARQIEGKSRAVGLASKL